MHANHIEKFLADTRRHFRRDMTEGGAGAAANDRKARAKARLGAFVGDRRRQGRARLGNFPDRRRAPENAK
ncbi:MAG: hypothetical protein PHY45_02325 [Rhodocyclaceae bacterium]|nr:hypothetical protein [Rhodocyclaceae bacterium]